MRRFSLYCMVIDNTYDYEDESTTTDDIEVAYNWLRAGCKEIVVLDACDLGLYYTMDATDLPEFKLQLDEC